MSASTSTGTGTGRAGSEEHKAVVRRLLDEVVNGHRLELLPEIFTEDYVEEIPFPGQQPGLEGLREWMGRGLDAEEDVRWVVQEMIAEGDAVFTRAHLQGTLRKPLLEDPAGQEWDFDVWMIHRFRDGKISATRLIDDRSS